MIQQNPRLADSVLQDPRMIDVLGVLMGIDMQGFSREEGSDELPPGVTKADVPSSSPPTSPKPSASSSKPAPAPEPEDVEMEDEDPEKKDAEAAKKAGSEAYKRRDFAEAAKNFEKAWEIWPKDVTFLTNLGAVYFEQGEYDKCIEACEKSVEEGRSVKLSQKSKFSVLSS